MLAVMLQQLVRYMLLLTQNNIQMLIGILLDINNNLIIQFSTTVQTNKTTSITFPIAYTIRPALCITFAGDVAAGTYMHHFALAITNVGYTRTATGSTYQYSWIAIGF